MIKGETVILLERTQTGENAFGEPIYTETEVAVNDVIVGTPSTNDMATDLSLYGKALYFVLGIPKGDTHDWKDKAVKIRGQKFKTYGFPLTQTAANVPTRWNTQVKVSLYE